MLIVGIDPGLSGALGFLGHRGEFVAVDDMPVMNRLGASAYVKSQVNALALEELLRSRLRDFDRHEVHVFIESPIAFPGQHVSATAATFLTSGLIEGVVAALHLPHTLVAPKDWKKAMALVAGKGMRKSELKDMARSRAIRLFPDAPLTRAKDHNRAEALLIAKYGYDLIA